MSGNSYGILFRVSTFGESHGVGLGAVVDGVPPGLPLSEDDIQAELDRRRPGQSAMTTARAEPDTVRILSGVFSGATTGTPVALLIGNQDSASSAYEPIRELFRPGHADYTYQKKYGIRDYRGGGRSSGRETAARVAAGAIAKKLLSQRGVSVLAYTVRAAGISCSGFDPNAIEKNPLRACDLSAAERMVKAIEEYKAQGDSAGGIVECRITGVAAGLGEPVFDKLDAELAKAMLSIGSVKGIEFGTGFACSDMRGSECNDQMDENGFVTNHSGGVLGGISTGQDIVFRIAVKPTPSVSVPQKTQDTHGNAASISVTGRHDPCICPRIVPVVEAMVCIVLEDFHQRAQVVRPVDGKD